MVEGQETMLSQVREMKRAGVPLKMRRERIIATLTPDGGLRELPEDVKGTAIRKYFQVGSLDE